MNKEVDSFTYYNKIKALNHEMALIVTKMDEVCSSIKTVYAELHDLSEAKPLATTMEEQKPYHESGNPHSETLLENIGGGG